MKCILNGYMYLKLNYFAEINQSIQKGQKKKLKNSQKLTERDGRRGELT